ncbi:3629_t:CDS:1, partial [Entrophospora sp. SA101]
QFDPTFNTVLIKNIDDDNKSWSQVFLVMEICQKVNLLGLEK